MNEYRSWSFPLANGTGYSKPVFYCNLHGHKHRSVKAAARCDAKTQRWINQQKGRTA